MATKITFSPTGVITCSGIDKVAADTIKFKSDHRIQCRNYTTGAYNYVKFSPTGVITCRQIVTG